MVIKNCPNESNEMQEQRLFVGNLPTDTSDKDLLNLFRNFNVKSTEIRRKNALDRESVFAYVNLPSKSVDACLRKLNNSKWNNTILKIEVAKENFLDRLNRERAAKCTKQSQETNPSASIDLSIAPKNTLTGTAAPLKNKKIKFDTDDDATISKPEPVSMKRNLCMFRGTDAYATQNLPFETKSSEPKKSPNDEKINAVISMKKFEDFSDVWKDNDFEATKIVNFDAKFERKKKVEVETEVTNQEHKYLANIKRRSALEMKRKSYQEKKSFIKNALKSKKIFNEENLDTSCGSQTEGSEFRTKKIALFDEDVDDDKFVPNFDIKPYLDGERGHKYLDLRSKLACDDRFKLDDKFFEADFSVHKKEKLTRPIAHYDPSSDPSNVERPTTSSKNIGKVKKKKKIVAEPSIAIKPAVSKEKHYIVSNSLKDAFNKQDQESPFSLTSIFDEKLTLEERNFTQPANIQPVRCHKSKLVNNSLKDPISDESSDYTDEESPLKISQLPNAPEKVLGKCGVWGETFFFKLGDSRLKEAELFFRQPEKIDHIEFGKQRTILKGIARKKIQRSKRDRKMFKYKLGGKINRKKFRTRLKKANAIN